jgi:hypothetical protein
METTDNGNAMVDSLPSPFLPTPTNSLCAAESHAIRKSMPIVLAMYSRSVEETGSL